MLMENTYLRMKLMEITNSRHLMMLTCHHYFLCHILNLFKNQTNFIVIQGIIFSRRLILIILPQLTSKVLEVLTLLLEIYGL